MAGPFLPDDTLVQPIVNQLVGVAQQITGIGRCYNQPPEGEPEDNSVVFPLRGLQVLDETNAKLKVLLTFEAMHFFRRRRLQDTFVTAQTYLMPWLLTLSAWPNQSLGGLAIEVNPKKQGFKAVPWGQQEYLVLSTTLTVLTEFNIPVS